MKRPFYLRYGKLIAWAAILMSVGIGVLYMPGMPSALIWPYEWLIVGVWAILGLVFYKITIKKHGAKAADEKMQEEIDRVV